MSNIVTILSGGLDSTVLAYLLAEEGHTQHFLSFNYGQRHLKELDCAIKTAEKLNSRHDIIILTAQNTSSVPARNNFDSLPDGMLPPNPHRPFGDLLIGSSLTDSKNIPVPEGHYEEENMSHTVVPGRNAMMLSIAWAVGMAEGCHHIACGVHAGDHAIYPDCRANFIANLNLSLRLGTTGRLSEGMSFKVPFQHLTKLEILKMGINLSVPFEDTWTCYVGGDAACGKCGSCVERLSSFEAANSVDPITYEDRESWVKLINDYKIKQFELAKKG